MDPDFRIYEALLWEPAEGYFLFERHLARLERTVGHFGFALDARAVAGELLEFARGLARPRKVRLELARDGTTLVEDVEVKPSTPVLCALGDEAVDSSDPFLRYKTSRRGAYERALAAHPDCDDVLLFNERGELTESCASNAIAQIDGEWLTPAAHCGLLPGTYRESLLEAGRIREAVLDRADLLSASRLRLINSVRRAYDAKLCPSPPGAR